MRGLLTILISLTLSINLYSQSNITVQYFGLTAHPFGDYTAEIQPYKLDKKARLVANFGGYISYEKLVWFDILSVRIKQGIFSDCSAGFMGVSHIGVNLRLWGNKKHRLSFAIGPAFIYRNSWNRFGIYENRGYWNEKEIYSQPTQYKTVLYACEFEYNYMLTKKIDLSVGFVPGFPNALALSVGAKFWLDKDFNPRIKLVRRK